MKKLLPAFSVLTSVLLLTACNGTATVQTPPEGNGTSSPAMDSSPAAMMESSSPETGARIIEMTAANWQFAPNAITLKKGEKVIVRLTDTEGMHSFLSQDLGINMKISAGETLDIEIPTDTAGTFSFRCGVPCGSGHRDMTGTIVIQ